KTMRTRARSERSASRASRGGGPGRRCVASTTTSPASNDSRPLMQRSIVLLPPPDGPMTAATSPRRTASDTPSSTRTPPYDLTRPRTSIIRLASSEHDVRPAPLQPPGRQRQRVTHEQVQDSRHQPELEGQAGVVV